MGLLIGFAGVAILFGFGPRSHTSGREGKYLTSILVIIAGGIGWTIVLSIPNTGRLATTYYECRHSAIGRRAIHRHRKPDHRRATIP